MENGVHKKLAFLDVFIDVSSNCTKTSIFRKSTFTGLLTNFNSFTSFSYKSGLIKCLIDRAYKINNFWSSFHDDLNKIKDILSKNCYPTHLVDRHIKSTKNIVPILLILPEITLIHVISNCRILVSFQNRHNIS